MAWLESARRMELQPESDTQPAIRPTQFIIHSIAAPWDEDRIYAYWRDSTSLESHLGLAYNGDCAQYIGTQTRADANMYANRRPDGTGAVSIETASNLQHTDPWTEAQMAKLIEVGVELHRLHGIPLRICRTDSDPGYGYHRLHGAWSKNGTACPGDARVRQFEQIVFPGIVRAAQGGSLPPTEDDMTVDEIAAAVWGHMLARGGSDGETIAAGAALGWEPAQHDATRKVVLEAVGQPVPVEVDAAAVAAALVADGGFADLIAEKVADLIAARLEA